MVRCQPFRPSVDSIALRLRRLLLILFFWSCILKRWGSLDHVQSVLTGDVQAPACFISVAVSLAMDSKLWRFDVFNLNSVSIICFAAPADCMRDVYLLCCDILVYKLLPLHARVMAHMYSILRRRLIIPFLDMSTGRFIVSSKRFGLWPMFNFQGAVSFLTVCMIAYVLPYVNDGILHK